MIRTLYLPEFTPRSLNTLMRGHWSKAHKAKKADKEVIFGHAHQQGLTMLPDDKRQVSLLIVLGKGQKKMDEDNLWKSLLDALVNAGVLVDDSPKWCQRGTVSYARGDAPATFVILEDV